MEKLFQKELQENPSDFLTLMAFHDWLLDQGRYQDAELLIELSKKEVKEFEDLLGFVLTDITTTEETIHMTTLDGRIFKLYHERDCCESVDIEDINGDLQDLVGSPLLQAEESSNRTDPPKECDWTDSSWTWTFYKMATIKGYVTIRWYGSSNGYYSESVDFAQV